MNGRHDNEKRLIEELPKAIKVIVPFNYRFATKVSIDSSFQPQLNIPEYQSRRCIVPVYNKPISKIFHDV